MGNAETDCRKVLEHLYLYLDGEIAGVACAEIEAHLERCADCLQHVGFERHFKDFVRRKCGEQPPADLIERVRARLREVL